MSIHSLNITTFRNLSSVQLNPILQGFNYIEGNNGSGKTSLLESIYYLSLARSFRGTIAPRVIHHTADKLSLFAALMTEQDQKSAVGLERYQNGDLKLRINWCDSHSILELTDLLPVQLIDTHCHDLLEGAPQYRRKYLDWGVFYHAPAFLAAWRRFMHALKQRNAALRRQLPAKELIPWTQGLIESGLALHQLRVEYTEQLIPHILDLLGHLFPIKAVIFKYESGWNSQHTYEDQLAQSVERDQSLGYTQWGPHKSDLRITINNIPAKDILSRGQQKLFVCAMILARGALLQRRTNKRLIYLVDDLPAELDSTNRCSLITLLSKQQAQIFVTATEDKRWDDFLTSNPIKLFHVEHGNVTAR